jgi:hypothetical protein
MQKAFLALGISCCSLYPARLVAHGRHAARQPSNVLLLCAAQVLTGSLLRGPASWQRTGPGRHRASEYRARRPVPTPPPRRTSHARGRDPASWHHQHIKSRASRSRMGAHG